MLNIKKFTIASLTLISFSASAEVSMNLGVTSNYMWRGVTQSDDGVAISGGIDYANDNGFYAGVWTGNVDFGASSGSGKGKWVWVCGRTSRVLPCGEGARALSAGWAGVANLDGEQAAGSRRQAASGRRQVTGGRGRAAPDKACPGPGCSGPGCKLTL